MGDFHIGRASAVARYGCNIAEYGCIGSGDRFANTILVPDGNNSLEHDRLSVFDCFAETAEI